MNRFLPASILWLTCLTATIVQGQSRIRDEGFRVLLFSKTTMYRHASITNGIAMVKVLGANHQFAVDATEDSTAFTRQNLARYKAVVFLSTSGDVLNDSQQAAFKDYLEQGGGLAAIHAAVAGKPATEGFWTWYVELFCTEFDNHKEIAKATVHVEDRTNASTAHLSPAWERMDEWYNFTRSPRGNVHVLARLEESSFPGGTMGGDHPIAWCKQVGRGRLWYTALGHTAESYAELAFIRHVLGGIEVAAGLKPMPLAERNAAK